MSIPSIKEKLVKLNLRYQKKQRLLQDPMYDDIQALKKEFNQNLQKIISHLEKCKAVGYSEKKLRDYQKQLKSAQNQINELKKQNIKKYQMNPESRLKTIALAIPRGVWWIIKNAVKLTILIVSLGFKISDEQFSKRIQELKRVEKQSERNIIAQNGCKDLLINEIIHFNQNELPRLESFIRELQQLSQ